MRPKVAVVHADHSVLGMFNEFLADEGFDVLTSSSPESALSIIRSVDPDLVIIDLQLRSRSPDWDLVQRLREEEAGTELPVIALTSEPRTVPRRPPNCQARCLVVVEPFSIDDFLTSVRSLLPDL